MKIEHKIRTFTWWWYLLIGITGLVVFGMIAYSHHKAIRMTTVYAPLIDAAMDIKLEATTAHLWFEEILSGDRHEDMEAVWNHLDQADWYARAMLEGGTNYEGTFIPLDDAEMRQNILAIRIKLSELKDITEKRLATIETSGSGTGVDQHYDEIFNSFIVDTNETEARLQEIMAQDLRRFRLIQTSLIVVSSLLLFVVGIVFYRFERHRTKDAIKIRHSNEELRKEIAERKLIQDRVSGFAHILEESLNEIYVFDAKTLRFIQVNKGARLNLGYSMEELCRMTPLDLKPEFTSESFEKLVEPLLTGKRKEIRFTTVHRRKDGSPPARAGK